MRTNDLQKPAEWTRRQFMRGAAGILVVPHLGFGASADPLRSFAYVPSSDERGEAAISVLALEQGRGWKLKQKVPGTSPAFLLHAPAQGMLYVANDVARHEGLARGSVEAYRVDPVEGTLSLVGRTPLSLSATHPRHLALSPDGKWLAVAAFGGGIYNLLPIAADGSLGAPGAIFKEIGCGPDESRQGSAHPHTMLFDPSGRHLITSDFGADRISVFRIENNRLVRRVQQSTGAGSGPGTCVLHPAGFLYVALELQGRIACYRYDAETREIAAQSEEGIFQSAGTLLALHPTGRALYATDSDRRTLKAWQVDSSSGGLGQAQEVSLGPVQPLQLSVSVNGDSVLVFDGTDSVVRYVADAQTGILQHP